MSKNAIYIRMSVYLVTIAMHVTNIVYMNNNNRDKIDGLNDPQLEVFSKLQARFFTCWTFFLQIVHAFSGLICDCLLIINSGNNKYKLPKHLRGFKNTLFSAVLWPSTWVVFSVFWSLYWYDRALIYPDFADKLLTPLSNHVMHTAIIPVVLLEVCLQRRQEPRSHKRNLWHLLFHFGLYFVVLVYTYVERSVWIYPVFAVFYGKIYFLSLPLGLLFLAIAYYFMQWPITRFFWGREFKQAKIR